MNAVNHTPLSEFLCVNEQRGNNGRAKEHFDNWTEGEDDRWWSEWTPSTLRHTDGSSGAEKVFSHTFLALSLTPPPRCVAPAVVDRLFYCRTVEKRTLEEAGTRVGWGDEGTV